MAIIPPETSTISRRESATSSSSDPSPRSTSSSLGSATPRDDKTDGVFSSVVPSPSSRRSSATKATPPQSPKNGSLADYERRNSISFSSMLDKLRLSSSSSSSASPKSSPETKDAEKRKRQGSMRGIPKELDHLRQDMVSPTFDQLKRDSFKLLSSEAIESMSPQERTLLQRKLQDEMARAPANSERITACLHLIASVQEQLRQKKLLALIINKAKLGNVVQDAKEAIKDDSIWEPLMLASESIIAPEELFMLIHQKVQSPPDESVIWLQLFCEHWLKANIGTSSVRKAEKSIRAIILHIKTNLPNNSQNRGTRIEEALEKALKPLPARKPLTPAQEKGCRHFEELEVEIAQGKFKSAKTLAEDLRQYQIMLYCQMSQSLLINAKWDVAPNELNHLILLSNNLADFIVDRVVSASNLKQCVLYISYFLEVAKHSMDFKDFATAHSIVSALSNGFITRLRVWPEVFKASGYKQLYEHLEGNLFCPNSNHKPLRQEMERLLKEKQYLYLPSWSPLTKDMIFINENRSFDTSEGKDPDYNYTKLLLIYTCLRPFFLPQEKWIAKQREQHDYKFQTNLVGICLKYKAFAEEDRKNMVTKLSPDRISSSGKAIT